MTKRQREAARRKVNAQLDALAAEAYGRRIEPPLVALDCDLCGETYYGRRDCPECSEPA